MSDKRETTEVKQQAKADLEEGKRQVQEATRDATAQGKQKLEEQGERAATGVDHVADAVGTAASRLSELEHQGLADYANQLASSLSNMSSTLREKNVDELTREVRNIAQRNPALFVLGSVAVGLGLARFAKSSSARKSAGDYAGDPEWRGDSEWQGDSELRGDDAWQGYEDEDFISDVAETERHSVDRQGTPDVTGGSGL